MPEISLTELGVRSLKGCDQSISYWDTITPGFFVRVGKRSKTFCVMRGRARERVKIGRFPAFSVAEARAQAKRLLSEEVSAPRPLSRTFAAARTEFLVEHYATKAPRTKYNVTKLLTRHFKRIEHKELADLDDTRLTTEEFSLSKSLDDLDTTAINRFELVQNVISFNKYAAEWFLNGDNSRKRNLLKIVGSYATLKGKILSIQAAEPFRLTLEFGEIPLLCGLRSDVRTISVEETATAILDHIEAWMDAHPGETSVLRWQMKLILPTHDEQLPLAA